MVDIPAIILIENLDPTSEPTLEHFVAAMKDGVSVKLSINQILALIATASIDANDIEFIPGSGITSTDVQAAILEVVSDLTALITPKFTSAPGTNPLALAGAEAVQRTWTAAMLRSAAIASGRGFDALLEDQQAQGVSGGTTLADTWQTRTLNTKVFDRWSFVTLSGNVFTPNVAALCEWRAPSYASAGHHQSRLVDITAGNVVVKWGSSAVAETSPNGQTDSVGAFTLVAGHDYRLESQGASGSASGFGHAANLGTEVYTQVKLWRLG